VAASGERAGRPWGAALARAGAGLAAAGLLATLPGCVSTQRKNERAKLAATRLLESRRAQPVVRPSRDVRVTGVQVIRGRPLSAVVVELRNEAARPRTDVPLAVGVRRPGGERVVLNGRGGLAWFQSHLPAIAAGGHATWVFTTRRPIPAGRAFASAGEPSGGVRSSAGSLPALTAAVLSGSGVERAAAGRAAARRLHVAVVNRSDVPQRDVAVYALVRAGRRYRAAGRAEVAQLPAHGRATVSIPLAGSPSGAAASVHAIPSIFE
jgi:hypothetical protein